MERTIHDLKIHPKYAELRKLGIKTFEIRKNDRPYRVGDILRLHTYAPGFGYLPDGGETQPTWCQEQAEVTWMTDFGMAEGSFPPSIIVLTEGGRIFHRSVSRAAKESWEEVKLPTLEEK